MDHRRKKGIALLKVLFSGLLLYLVFDRIPFSEVWKILRSANPGFLLLAVVFFTLSKILAAFRLNLYFFKAGLALRHRSNLKLYWQGMCYNLFLPGGISGDAYKGYILQRTFQIPVKRLVSSLVLDRLSGLYLLLGFCVLLLPWSQQPVLTTLGPWAMLIYTVSLGVYWYVHRRAFGFLQPIFWRSLGYSAFVQFAQLICVCCILVALGITQHSLEYLLVFLLSSLVAVLPVTIGGIGSREIVFYYGAHWLGLEEEASIGVSVAFFAITALVSLGGMSYHFRKPRLELR